MSYVWGEELKGVDLGTYALWKEGEGWAVGLSQYADVYGKVVRGFEQIAWFPKPEEAVRYLNDKMEGRIV